MLHIEIGHKVPRNPAPRPPADRQASPSRWPSTWRLPRQLPVARDPPGALDTDELTGLFNRRYMEDSLDREVRRTTAQRPTRGDHAGSRPLQADERRVRPRRRRLRAAPRRNPESVIRAEDIACRFGGEEFVIILPKATLEDTRRRAEALRLGIRTLHADPARPTFPTLTMSMGVAGYPDHGTTGEALLRAADSALYRGEGDRPRSRCRRRNARAGCGDRRRIAKPRPGFHRAGIPAESGVAAGRCPRRLRLGSPAGLTHSKQEGEHGQEGEGPKEAQGRSDRQGRSEEVSPPARSNPGR